MCTSHRCKIQGLTFQDFLINHRPDTSKLFMNDAQHNPVGLTYLPSDFLSVDLLQRQNGFGFSPGTSPAPNDVKNEGTECYFSSQNRDLPISQSSYWAPNDSRYRSALKNPLYQPAFQQLAHQPSRLHIPSPTSQQKHGQLTPPSETTPTKESPLAETLQDSMINTVEPQNGPTTRKRRSTQSSRIKDASSHTTPTNRRRKKSARKQSSVGLAVEGDDKRSQFLERNRVAASKCRQKKKEWTSNLEQKARELQASKTSLALLVTSLREELLYLKASSVTWSHGCKTGLLLFFVLVLLAKYGIYEAPTMILSMPFAASVRLGKRTLGLSQDAR
ncbi:hypothetical protein GJ744_004780 [Endocarpon pusillum]|uniref:BZIP domain-containing protein n=1 Tax=Endocarpon pusillum TaxID=364733 RepID=A0A8H7A9D9_9EURO|nr:hypothetical protein GJ744_004780 [Endocarpon pusillum]